MDAIHRGRKRQLEGTGEFEEDDPLDSERRHAYQMRSDVTARVRRSREASQVQYIATHPACRVSRSR